MSMHHHGGKGQRRTAAGVELSLLHFARVVEEQRHRIHDAVALAVAQVLVLNCMGKRRVTKRSGQSAVTHLAAGPRGSDARAPSPPALRAEHRTTHGQCQVLASLQGRCSGAPGSRMVSLSDEKSNGVSVMHHAKRRIRFSAMMQSDQNKQHSQGENETSSGTETHSRATVDDTSVWRAGTYTRKHTRMT